MISLPVSSIFPYSPLPSWTWRTPGLSIPWCCLFTSSSVCLVFFQRGENEVCKIHNKQNKHDKNKTKQQQLDMIIMLLMKMKLIIIIHHHHHHLAASDLQATSTDDWDETQMQPNTSRATKSCLLFSNLDQTDVWYNHKTTFDSVSSNSCCGISVDPSSTRQWLLPFWGPSIDSFVWQARASVSAN